VGDTARPNAFAVDAKRPGEVFSREKAGMDVMGRDEVNAEDEPDPVTALFGTGESIDISVSSTPGVVGIWRGCMMLDAQCSADRVDRLIWRAVLGAKGLEWTKGDHVLAWVKRGERAGWKGARRLEGNDPKSVLYMH